MSVGWPTISVDPGSEGVESRVRSGWSRWFWTLWLVTLASVPLSLRWPFSGGRTIVAVPLEPLLVVCVVLLAVLWVLGEAPARRLLRHPVSLMIAAGLVWTVVTAMTSVDPVVSLKYALMRTAYVMTFFVGGLVVFSRLGMGTAVTVSAGLAGVLPTVGWTVWHHAPSWFAHTTSFEVGRPFFPNHLEYGATLVFWMLVMAGLALQRHDRKGGYGGGWALLIIGLVPVVWAAHSLAAWLSLMAGLGVIALHALGLRVQQLMIIGALVLVVVFGSFGIYRSSGLGQSWKPSDPSTGERLNRWLCAFEMGRERPLVGFGPGTYETSYGVFQSWENLTSHSSFQGDRGDAHSEYFSALAEQGVPGLMLVVALFGVALWSGLHGAVETKNGDRRWLILGWTAAVTSLAVGSLFNAYFEVDRIAPLLWLSCAALAIFSATSPENR